MTILALVGSQSISSGIVYIVIYPVIFLLSKENYI